MTFEKSEIEPEFRELTKAEKCRASALTRKRTPDGKFCRAGRYCKTKKNGPDKWVPSDEFIQMVRETLIEEGFPISRVRFSKRKRRATIRLKCRGYDETHFVLKRFYTPFHIRQFLKLWMRWDDPARRPKNGRPKNPPKPPKDWTMDRRTKAWRSKMLHKPTALSSRGEHPHGPRRRGKLLAPR